MNETINSEPEDSFFGKKSARKGAARVIDSDSDEENAEPGYDEVTDSLSDDSTEQPEDEDKKTSQQSPQSTPHGQNEENTNSFREETDEDTGIAASTKVDPVDMSYSDEDEYTRPQKNSANLTVDTTEDEDSDFVPQNDNEVIESSDEEEKNHSSEKCNTSLVNNFRESAIKNNSIYRDIVENSDDDDDSDDERKISESSEDIPEVIEKSMSVIEVVSSDEEPSRPVPFKQTNIKSFLTNFKELEVKKEPQPQKQIVGPEEYQEQVKKVSSIEADLQRTKNAMRVIKLENLPDNGKSLIDKEKSLNTLLQEQQKVLAEMVVNPTLAQNKIEIAWEDIEAGVGPKTKGKKGIEKFNTEKQLAVETLDHLHKSLDTCPKENDSVDDPKGLKVPLMPHQRRALAWLLWRENQKPSGGLLADDMGLGKTLTMISLILKSRELGSDDQNENESYRDKYPGGTLVVCPASLMNQWSGEIEQRTKRGLLSVEVYHGPKRETKPKRLARHDVVVTTYSLALNENNRNGALFGVRWRRIILDEAHQIRNHKSQTSEAVFRLSGKSRWALSGTPVHNKELDMYAIFKFLRCSPFDDLQIWKRWVGDKSTGGQMRLHAVISSLMLRRTKQELMEKGSLQSLPGRTWELISIKLEKDEMNVYQKVLIFSRKLFAQFLHQRAEKSQDARDLAFNGAPPDPNGEYFKMRNKLLKMNRVKEVSQHEILVLLLRLRQICCHPSLIKQMLQGDEDLGGADDSEESEEMNLLEQLNRLDIHEEDEHAPPGSSDESVGLKDASKGFLNPGNPVFLTERRSSKIEALIKLLQEKVSGEDKAIVVSQWTGLLNLVSVHLTNEGIVFDNLNGSIPVHKRMPIVDNFNDPRSDTKVLLLSLTAGGVGLNLVGANHLFLLDLHWNPQLESQAQDRIYRMGQKKAIFVYKFMAVDTIEERIKALQDTKLGIAESMLTGSKRVGGNKLSLQDLKMLFGFN